MDLHATQNAGNYTAAKIKMFRALGTVNTIQTFGDANAAALESAAQRVLELDDRLSVFKPESDVARLNEAAGARPVSIGEDAMRLLSAGRRFSMETAGAFSITTRPLTALWNAHKKLGTVPDEDEIGAACALLGDAELILNEAAGTAMLPRYGQAVDLGAIAKGYAADEVLRILRECGVENALINLGGTVAVLGEKRWVGIQHPDRCAGIPMGRLAVENGAVVTSGDYERYYVVDGVRYHHILDPRTGRPARANLRSVTLAGLCAMELDALSTAVFVLGAEEGARIARAHGYGLVLVTEAMDVLCSDGLCGSFALLLQTQSVRAVDGTAIKHDKNTINAQYSHNLNTAK